MSHYQIPSDASNEAAFLVVATTKQEQIPGAAFVLEGSSGSTLNEDKSSYYMAC